MAFVALAPDTLSSQVAFAPVESAAVARAAYSSASRAMRSQDLASARREADHAAAAWPLQPLYIWTRAILSARASDTTSLRDALAAYAGMGMGRDIWSDSLLVPFLGREDLKPIAAELDANRKPWARSRIRHTLPDSSFWPEGVDFDPRTGRFYLTSVRYGTILEFGSLGRAREIMPRRQAGIGAILAVRVDTARGVLWATTSGIPQTEGFQPSDSSIAALLRIRIRDGVIERRFDLPPGRHVLGDVALGANGDVYFTDSQTAALYWLKPDETITRITSPLFRSPQGIAPRPDGRAVYVADYSHGMLRVDLETLAVSWLGTSPGGTTIGCDGIVWNNNGIIAIQNGVAPARVVRFDLNVAGTAITRATVIDRNTDVADEPTIGAVVGSEFVYVANSQWEKRDDNGAPKAGARLTKPVLLSLPLSRP